MGPDEPRYAAIARGMLESHDWVTPRLWGAPWFEKPVLYYWAAGAAMRVFGVNESAARLPSALAALLAVLAAAWTAVRCYGIRACWYVLLMLPASVALIGFARAASPDMLFGGTLTAAAAVACAMLQKARPGPYLRIAFGVLLGAAALAKGPAAILLVGGATLLWAAVSRQWRASLRFLHPLGILSFCLTALPWYILCSLRNPDFLRIFIWQHNLERYLTPIFEHRQPFWFYLPVLFVAILPWLPVLVANSADITRAAAIPTRMDSPGVFMACWAVFPVLFFSLSQSKLPGYILPAIPALFVVLGSRMARAAPGNTGRFSAALIATSALLLAVLAVGSRAPLQRIAHLYSSAELRLLIFSLAGVAGCCVLGIALTLLKKPHAALAAIAFSVAMLVLIANIGILPHLESQFSARRTAHNFIRQTSESREAFVYELPRQFHYGLNFYFDRDLPEWNLDASHPQWVFTNDAGRNRLVALGTHLQVMDTAGAPFLILVRVAPPR